MEKKIKSELIYEGKILNLTRDQVLLDDNKITFREIVHHRGGVAILACSNDNKFFLVKQYRYSISQYTLEIPAGKLELNDKSILDAAKRELEEEIGYIANNIVHLGLTYPSPGYTSEPINIFYASDLIKTQTNYDEDEQIEIFKLSLEQILEMIKNGQITDGKTINAIFFYQNYIAKKQ